MVHFVEYGEGRHKVWLDIIDAGHDLIVFIGGGEKPHVGAISVCTFNGSPFTISLLEHKDYIITHNASQIICKETGRNTTVLSGIHIDNASEKDIEVILRNSKECTRMMLRKMLRT
ncbi:MAG: prenylated flavin chaperone LpdD [Candidatus Methanomethylicaceae archaeon]